EGEPALVLLQDAGEERQELPPRIALERQLAHALQRAELDARHCGLVAQSKALPRVAVAPAPGEEGFDHHQACELVLLPRLLHPSTQDRLQELLAGSSQIVAAHDRARGLVIGGERLDAEALLLVRRRLERGDALAAQVIDRAILADAEEILLERVHRI